MNQVCLTLIYICITLCSFLFVTAPLAVVCKRPNCNTDSVKVTADETVPFSCVTAATGSPVTDAQWTVHAGDNEELLDKGKCPAGPFQSCSIRDQMLTIHNHTAFLSPTDNFYTIRCCTLATNDTSAEFTVHVGFASMKLPGRTSYIFVVRKA